MTEGYGLVIEGEGYGLVIEGEGYAIEGWDIPLDGWND